MDLQQIIRRIYPFRAGLFNNLTAVECSLISHLLQYDMTEVERNIYLNPVKQLGDWEDWTRRKIRDGYSAVLVGKDVSRMLSDINDPIRCYAQETGGPGTYTIWVAVIHPLAAYIRQDHGLGTVDLQHMSLLKLYPQAPLFEYDYDTGSPSIPSLMIGSTKPSELTRDVHFHVHCWGHGPHLFARGLIIRTGIDDRGFRFSKHTVNIVERALDSNSYTTSYLLLRSDPKLPLACRTIGAELEVVQGDPLCQWNDEAWLCTSQEEIQLAVVEDIGEDSQKIALFHIPIA